MGASDNLIAGLAGATAAGQDIVGLLLGSKIRERERRNLLQDELELYRQKLPLQTSEDVRQKQLTSDIDFKRALALLPHQTEARKEVAASYPNVLVDEQGNPISTIRGRVTKIGKKSRKIITSEQAEQLRAMGTEITDDEYVVKDVPGSAKDKDVQSSAKFVIDEVTRILPLNEKSSGGFFGGLRQKAMSAMDIEDEKFRNTEDVVNTARSMVARVLKSTFGGQLSDGEREYLNSVYGAMPQYSRAQRRIALNNIKRMMEGKMGGTSGDILDISRKAARPPLESFEE